MDWNRDGRVDVHDYAYYKSVIDINNSLLGSGSYSISNGSREMCIFKFCVTMSKLKYMKKFTL